MEASGPTKMTPSRCVLLVLTLALCYLGQPRLTEANLSDQRYAPVKYSGFRDPNTNYLYRVTSYNATGMTTEMKYRSIIKVTRERARNPNDMGPAETPEVIQHLKYHETLVDYDLHCLPTHCYLVTVTSRSRKNVQLFVWLRTQFDSVALRDSFSRPQAVKLFRIHSGFYIALAQDQLHLSPYRVTQDWDEPIRFIGCTILKFFKGREKDVKYHQFIRLPFNPSFVNHYTSINSNNITNQAVQIQPLENHHLIFSQVENWVEPGPTQVNSYIWSPLNDYFWPYRLPRNAELRRNGQVVSYPVSQPFNQTRPQDIVDPVETCFHQLQRLLADRDLKARRLIESSGSIWRANHNQNAGNQLMNMTAQVIVYGNVTVVGSLIESPQISLIASHARQSLPSFNQEMEQLVRSHSPIHVDNKFTIANNKINYIRNKLAGAVLANASSDSPFLPPIRFFKPIEANEIIFGNIANSNVRLNGIPFRQLEHELVSLNGVQNIAPKVVFEGRVVADVLEIHGSINDQYYLKDAVDITSRHIQIIDTVNYNQMRSIAGAPSIEFSSISAPEVILTHNSTINSIRLDDFITRDNRTQYIYGRKSFKRLLMKKLELASPGVRLNDFNISRLANNALYLRDFDGQQTIMGPAPTFTKSVQVKRLFINSVINQHINLTALIHDSVKTNDVGKQEILGQKSFFNTLKINRLTTEGAINGIEVSQIFNLNGAPPTPEHQRYGNYSTQLDVPITGEFRFLKPVTVYGNLNAGLVNNVNIAQRAVRRVPLNLANGYNASQIPAQIIRGRKVFYKPLRVLGSMKLLDPQQMMTVYGNNTRMIPYPMVNNIDLRLVNAGLLRQRQQPSLIQINNLEIEGNLYLPSSPDRNGSSRVILGNFGVCPLDLIYKRLVLAGEDQTIEGPVRVDVLRAKSMQLVDSGTLNGLKFPADFVMRTSPTVDSASVLEPVYGIKQFEHLVVAQPMVSPITNPASGQYPVNLEPIKQGIRVERGVTINQLGHDALQTYIEQERKRNSTGEKLLNTMNVYGNLYSKRINGYSWPDDILLKSLSSTRGRPTLPYQHKRIYSPLIFLNSSKLQIVNQLVLRGPIHLDGRVNGVNLTDFARHSATYGDKDLYSAGRPIRNKLFLGGLTVKGEIRSQGLIDGVNFDEMSRRVVTIGPANKQVHIHTHKMFMSDVIFNAPVNMYYLNDLPIDQYLRRIQFQPDGITLRIPRKKTITGALRINRNLFVSGLINGINFPELKARAISLAPTNEELVFNKTLTVEGDVFMDNLWIDERNGTIDGVKLTNLLPIGSIGRNELILNEPRVIRRANPFDRVMQVDGSLLDCKVSCNLQPPNYNQPPLYYGNQTQQMYRPTPARPIVYPTQSVMGYTSRPTLGSQARGLSMTRTTPPYSLSSTYEPPMNTHRIQQHPQPIQQHSHRPQIRQEHLVGLMNRKPMSIKYEQSMAPNKRMSMSMKEVANEDIERLKYHIVSNNLVRPSQFSHFVVGFIEAPTNDIAGYELPEEEPIHNENIVFPKSYLQLDQFDFPFLPTVYHLSVGVATNQIGQNVTSVFSSLAGSNLHELSVLPVEYPNSAMFLRVNNAGAVFLLLSQDYSIKSGMCATGEMISSKLVERNYNNQQSYEATSRAESGIHVYLFHALQNSSSLESAYFDLYQTLDLPGIDGFEKFTYRDSTYVLAISRSVGRIYILILRGYTGFQLVSHIDTPLVERVSVMYTSDRKPVLIIHQTTGLHRLMEAVII